MVSYQNIEFVIVSYGGNVKPTNIIQRLTPNNEDEIEEKIWIWHLSNKYFNADVKIHCCDSTVFSQNFHSFEKLEAVLFLFDYKEDNVFEEIKKTGRFFQDENPELRMVWETSGACIEDDMRDEMFSWCLDHQFELIENEDENEEENDDGDFKDKYGVERIYEALRSHMWANHKLKGEDDPSMTIPSALNGAGGNLLPSTSSSTSSSTSAMNLTGAPDEKLFENGDSFEHMFGKLHSMKEEAQNLEGDARKDYAERVAYAFMEALGIDDDDDEGESDHGDR